MILAVSPPAAALCGNGSGRHSALPGRECRPERREAASRATSGTLPGVQDALCDAVFACAKAPVITILFSGRPLTVPKLAGKSAALLAAWFPGSEAGHGLADLLFGKISPSAKTPVSWPGAVGQVPVFYGERNGGRPYNPGDHYTSHYMDVPNAPLFGFGHGLSYGRFVYSGLSLSATTLKESGVLTVSIVVRNEGRHAAEETVFLFIHDKLASLTRPLLELKGFEKILLEPGAEGQRDVFASRRGVPLSSTRRRGRTSRQAKWKSW